MESQANETWLAQHEFMYVDRNAIFEEGSLSHAKVVNTTRAIAAKYSRTLRSGASKLLVGCLPNQLLPHRSFDFAGVEAEGLTLPQAGRSKNVNGDSENYADYSVQKPLNLADVLVDFQLLCRAHPDVGKRATASTEFKADPPRYRRRCCGKRFAIFGGLV